MLLPVELRLLSLARSRAPLPPILCSPSLFLRSLSSTSTRSRSLESPTYPGLYYHSLPSPPHAKKSYTLSFLSTPPPTLDFSPTTIGVLAPKLVKDESGEGEMPDLVPGNFEENGEFRELLHDVLSEAVKTDLWIDTLAKSRIDGYIHVADERNPADPNRVPDPNDIIASVLIQDRKVTGYESGDWHRIVTMDGMMKLNKGLMDQLLIALEKVRNVEIEVASSAGD